MKDSKVKPGDWIMVGKNGKSAVVCCVYDDKDEVEVVYLDGGRAINEDVIWKIDHWEFKIEGPCGGYADNYSRLSDYVAILRRGR